MENCAKHILVGKKVKKVLEKYLNDTKVVTVLPCVYTYYISVTDTELNKEEKLQVNLLEGDKIQLRCQKENDCFHCFHPKVGSDTVEEIAKDLLKAYLDSKMFEVKQKDLALSFHKSMLQSFESYQ